MLLVEGISKRFGAVVALEQAGLTVAPGSIHALLGANGSGKSTLVKILAGVLKPDSGSVRIAGEPVRPGSAAAAQSSGIAVAFQELSLIPSLTVAQNILLGVEVRNRAGFVAARRIRTLAEEALAKVGLSVRPDDPIGHLSLAELHLLEIAKALVRRPRFLILDEATASLRHQEVRHLFGVLRELCREGVGVLFVSHRFDEIYDVCDTATVLCGGRSSGPYALADTSQEVLVRAMTGGARGPEAAGTEGAAGSPAGTGAAGENRAEAPHEPHAGGVVAGGSADVPQATPDRRDPRVTVRGLRGPGLRGVDLSLAAGEVVGIGGLQGQGQSVLIRGLAGLQKVAGDVLLDGLPVRLRSPHQAARQGIVFISGDRAREGIFPGRSLEENVAAADWVTRPLWRVLPGLGRDGRVQEIVRRLNVVHHSIVQPAMGLSGGNQQKLLVGRALYRPPRLLVLDDPTKGVDVAAREEIHRLLREIARQGVPVVLTSSDDHELARVCDRILILYGGAVVDELRAPVSGRALTEASIAAAQGRQGADSGPQRPAAGSAGGAESGSGPVAECEHGQTEVGR